MAALVGIRGQTFQDRTFDASGTIASGSAAQLILPQAHARSSFFIQNIHATASMFLEFGAARATATLTSNGVSAATVTNVGFGYSLPPNVHFYGGAFGPKGNPQIAPAYSLQGLPEWTNPNSPAKAHCVMTGSAGAMTVSSIVIDSPGSGYAYPPFVLLTNSSNDPFGCAVPSATNGIELLPGGSYYSNGSICTTDQVSIFCATATAPFTCKFTL